MDLIQELGPLAFASRLKRLSERLMRDGSRIYHEHGLDFEPRWFAVTFLLSRSSPMAVTAIADTLGLTHPAINQIAGQMERRGLLVSHKDKSDERRRLLSLSPKGLKLVKELDLLWNAIKDCTDEMLRQSGHDVLGMLAAVEAELDRKDMFTRVTDRVKQRQYDAIEIMEYSPAYKRYFKSLNLEWLKEFFEVEALDAKILNNPQKEIIDAGGYIIFARLDGKIVGTAALIKHDERTYEIAKMAVTPAVRGRRVGLKLTHAAIEIARRAGAAHVVLETSPKLAPALALYEKLGFVKVPYDNGKGSKYKRKSIMMKLVL